MSTITPSRRDRLAGGRAAARPALLVAAIGAFDFVVAFFATSSVAMTVMAIAGVAAVTACLLWPTLIMCAAFPASFATWRVGPAAVDQSVADVVTLLALTAALPFIPWTSRAFRRIWIAMLVYSAVVGVAVVAHFSTAGAVEVGHRFVMIVGTVAIGATVVRRGKVTHALRALLLVACVISVGAIVDTLSNDLKPAYAFGLPKNSVGSLLATTLVCTYFGRGFLRLPTSLVVAAGVLIAGGLAATQCRGAGVALGVVLALFLVRNLWKGKTRRVWKLAPLVLLLGVGLGTAMVLSFQSQANRETGVQYKFSSAGSRQITYSTVWDDVITPDPIVGQGPKWFNQPHSPASEPHNFILDELAGDGVLGLLGLALVIGTCLSVSGRVRSPLGELAWYVLIARLVAASTDIFWVAGPNTLPFLIVGLAVGAASLEEPDPDRRGATTVALR